MRFNSKHDTDYLGYRVSVRAVLVEDHGLDIAKEIMESQEDSDQIADDYESGLSAEGCADGLFYEYEEFHGLHRRKF